MINNYDAFFGKVANFEWTFNSDTYDIGLDLITIGDVNRIFSNSTCRTNMKVQADY